MDWREHLEVGLFALDSGLLDARAFAEAILEVGRSEGPISPEMVWLQPGRLTARQLEVLLDKVAQSEEGRAASTRDLDRYVKEGVLGAGAMGEVAMCIDRRLGRKVALKSLLPELAASEVALAMLDREARITSGLEHPHIVPVYDAGRDPRRGPYYIMRIATQPSLAVVLAELRKGEPAAVATYGLPRLLRYFVQVCNAVGYAHSRGVIHCDLKPANILLGDYGEVLIVDWGLACRIEEDTTYRGGTPGYIPPERLRAGHPVDARTDVFALGAVLYELLCLSPALEHRGMTEMELASITPGVGFRPTATPRQRAPERAIPAELDDICMKALAIDPADRYPTADAMAEALESFLEGKKERERRLERAGILIGEGDELAHRYAELVETRPERVAELRSLRASLAPWSETEQKTALWDGEDRLRVLDALAVRTLHSAIAAYEQALAEVPASAPAMRGLARLYRAQLERARERRDEFERTYFEELMKQYEDEPAAAAPSGGTLRLSCRPSDAEVVLLALGERGRRLVTVREERLGPAPLHRTRLAAGSYVVLLQRSGAPDVRLPLVVHDGDDLALEIDLDVARDVDEGEVFVAGGVALLGGDGETIDGTELRRTDIGAFVIGTRPVRFSEYLEFVRSAYETHAAGAHDLLPLAPEGTPYWRWERGEFVPARVTEWGAEPSELLALPAVGVDARSAGAFAAWRSQQSSRGRRYRLPTEDEWEKAARGVDGRRYPWGDAFDASFCKMRESRPGRPRPEPSGAFATDVSPFGVHDTAGGVADWVTTAAGAAGSTSEAPETLRIVSRGGAWSDGSADCRSTSRRPYLSTDKTGRVAFRLARTVAAPAPAARLSSAVTALLRRST